MVRTPATEFDRRDIDVTEEKQIADFIQRTFECKRYSYSPCSQLCSAEYYRTVCTDCQALERNERDFMVMGQIQTMLRDDTPKGSKAPAKEVHTSFYHKGYCICATFRFLHLELQEVHKPKITLLATWPSTRVHKTHGVDPNMHFHLQTPNSYAHSFPTSLKPMPFYLVEYQVTKGVISNSYHLAIPNNPFTASIKKPQWRYPCE